MPTLRLVIADSRTLFRQGLAAILTIEPDMEVVGEAGDAAELRRVCARTLPDIVLMDAALPDPDGGDAAAEIAALKACCPGIAVVILGEADNPAADARNDPGHDGAAEMERKRLVRAGAAACLRPVIDRRELVRVLRALAAKEKHADTPRSPEERETLSASHARTHLTPREARVVGLVAVGLCNKEIAHRLGISVQTVKNHISHLLEKLALADRTQLAVYALGIERGQTERGETETGAPEQGAPGD